MAVSDKLNLSGENSVKDCFVTVNHIPKQYSCVPHLLHAYMYLKAQCFNCIFSRKRKLKNITRKRLMITDSKATISISLSFSLLFAIECIDMPRCPELCYTQISYHSYVYILCQVILTLRLYNKLTCMFS